MQSAASTLAILYWALHLYKYSFGNLGLYIIDPMVWLYITSASPGENSSTSKATLLNANADDYICQTAGVLGEDASWEIWKKLTRFHRADMSRRVTRPS